MRNNVIRIFAHGGIGDAIMLTSSIRFLKEQMPSRRIEVYCHQPVHRAVLMHNPNIDVLCMAGAFYRIMTLWYRVVYQKPFAHPILGYYNHFPPTLYPKVHVAQILGAGFGYDGRNPQPELFLMNEEITLATRQLADFKRPIVALHSSSVNVIKNWTVDGWQEVVRNFPLFHFIQLGGRDDDHIKGAMDFRGLPLRQSLALLFRSNAFIGIDSGLSHAAAAFSIPRIILFGATSPVRAGYPGGRHIYYPPRCSPCFEILLGLRCPFSHECMKGILPSEVASELSNILGQSRNFRLHRA